MNVKTIAAVVLFIVFFACIFFDIEFEGGFLGAIITFFTGNR